VAARASRSFDQVQPWRLGILGLVMTAGALVILQHLFWYQVTDQQNLLQVAEDVHEVRRSIAPHRGALLDARGHPLAVTVSYQSLYVFRAQMKDPDKTAAALAPMLDMSADEIGVITQQSEREWKRVKERVPSAIANQIEAKHLPGVDLRPVRVRDYPEGSTAAQVLGFVGLDGRGLSGLELTLDEELTGTQGLLVSERDTEGREIYLARKQLLPAQGGADVVLTIDRQLQRTAERILEQAIQENKGTGGVIIVMDPATGGILALASRPTFTLSPDLQIERGRESVYKPTPVTDTYEPGSVLKLMTVAAAVEEHVVNANTPYFDSGVAVIDGTPIRNWDGRGYGTVTVRQILQYSLNTGSQWVAGQLGADRFYRYLDAFGFGHPTGLPLNGEAAGYYRTPGDSDWSRTDLATNAYGQSITATPLQVISAVASLANGGVRMKPQLVKEIRGQQSVRKIESQVAQRVVSEETAETMLDMMNSVWEQPSLQANWIRGYSIAGKSGTADIAGPGGYNGKTYASFVGLGPMPNPKFAVLVRVDQPETTWGGLAAAPAIRSMFEDIFSYLKIPPSRP
jgi:cell division protein FtsI/penicillin-binding protein 2